MGFGSRVVTLLLFTTAAFAADSSIPSKDVKSVRATKSPVIDGVLDEEVWSLAPAHSEFVQHDPEDGKPPSENTTVRVAYDDDAIYFAARLHDSRPVTARLGRRDTSIESDWFRVYLDPQNDRRSGAAFYVNPANVQGDAVLYNDSWDDPTWDAVWQSATKVDSGGWTVEMKIPFSQLHFPEREVHVWGVNFIRRISSRNEQDRFVNVPKTESGFVSRFARLNGIHGVQPKRGLEILPYAVARADMSTSVDANDPYHSPTEPGADLGLDVKYSLTSNLRLTGTINPDFGQVEVDPARLNLTQFELFFPEKRPFFIEGSNLFAFGQGGSNNNFGFNFGAPNFFYSRRVGRSPQGTGRLDYDYIDAPSETTILAAAKLTGKTESGWTIAAFDAVTQKEQAHLELGLSRERQTIEPATNYFVSRIAKDLGTRGRIGALVTATTRETDADTNFLRKRALFGGTDGYWAFGNRDVILEWVLGGTLVQGSEEAIAATQESPAHYYHRPDAESLDYDPNRTSLSGLGGRVMLAKQTGLWKYNLQAQSYSPGFETNDAGFQSRADITATHAVIMYNNPEVTARVRHRGWWLGKYQNFNYDGDLIANGFYGNASIDFTNDRYIYTYGGPFFERLDDRNTRGGPLVRRPAGMDLGGGYGLAGRGKLFYEMDIGLSENSEGGRERAYTGMVGLRPRPNLKVELRPTFASTREHAQYVTTIGDETAVDTYGGRYVFATLDQKTLEIGTRVDWTFTSKLSLQLYVQPFIASGNYHGYKELERPRSMDYAAYGIDRGTIDQSDGVLIDPDGTGPAASFSFDNPDFNFRSLRGSAVARWEFRPGSALYVVWSENREDSETVGDFRPRRDFSGLASGESEDVFMIKMSYWLPF